MTEKYSQKTCFEAVYKHLLVMTEKYLQKDIHRKVFVKKHVSWLSVGNASNDCRHYLVIWPISSNIAGDIFPSGDYTPKNDMK